MKITIISDAPNMDTGYGRIARYLGYYLSKNNEISYIGLQHRGYPLLYKFKNMESYIYSGIVFKGNQDILDRSMDSIKPQMTITIRDPVTFDPIRFHEAFSLSKYKKIKKVSYIPAMTRFMPTDIIKSLIGSSDYIITYTDAARMVYLSYGIPYNLVETVNIGYDNEVFYPKKADYFGDNNVFSFIGLMTNTRKKLSLLMKAFREYLYRYDHTAKLYIHGTDILAYDINAIADMLGIKGHILLPDHWYYEWGIPDGEMADIYRSSKAVLSFSPEEGYNMPFLEAMACGTPAIGNDSPFYDWSDQIIKVPSIESEEGSMAYGYVSDPAKFADVMAEAHPPIQTSKLDELHWDKVASRFEKVIERI